MNTVVIALAVCTAAAVSALPRPEERLQPYESVQYEPPQYEPPQYEPPQFDGSKPQSRQGYKPDPYHKEPAKPYAFDYGVRDDYSGANYGHSETSNGNSVEGSYQVALPDGRIQIVKYVADHENGFQAQVEYEGEARYPDHVEQTYKPSYKSAPKYHHQRPSEPEVQSFQDLPEGVPVYHSEA